MKIDDTDNISYADDDELVTQFVEWTDEAISELRSIVGGFSEPTLRSHDTIKRLYDLVHNIKGMGTNFNFDLLTNVGASLCGYLKYLAAADPVSKRVLEAHVRALEVVLQHKITGDGGEQGAALTKRLQAIMDEES